MLTQTEEKTNNHWIGKQNTATPHTDSNQHLIINELFAALYPSLSCCCSLFSFSPAALGPQALQVMEYFNETCFKHGQGWDIYCVFDNRFQWRKWQCNCLLLCLHDYPHLVVAVGASSLHIWLFVHTVKIVKLMKCQITTLTSGILCIESYPASYQIFTCHLSDEIVAQ